MYLSATLLSIRGLTPLQENKKIERKKHRQAFERRPAGAGSEANQDEVGKRI
jgi:hypothetical protein